MEYAKSTLWKIGGIAALIILAIFMFKAGSNESPTGNFIAEEQVTLITTTLQGYKYIPDTLTVNQGDRVKLTIINKDDVTHGLHLPQFGISESTPAKSTKTFEFVANERPVQGKVPTCITGHDEILNIIVNYNGG